MCEEKKKQTLAQIRMQYHFDIPKLAKLAGISSVIVYHARVQQPIYTKSAEKILEALSQYTGLQSVFYSHRHAGVQRKVRSHRPPAKLINKLLCHICSSSLSNTVIGVQRVFGCERYGILCSANQRTLSVFF